MNIVLIGMPGCGKSTIGVLLAKTLMMDFVDTDLIIQNRYNSVLVDLIESKGIEGFKYLENDLLKTLRFENTVIATGGSAVYGEDAMGNLKRNATTVYLKLTTCEIESRIKNITTRGIVMQPDCTIEELLNERAPLYERYADVIFECDGKTVEETVSLIKEQILELKRKA